MASRLETGYYRVELPRPVRRADGGNVQVTTGSGSEYCNVVSWFDSHVNVMCFDERGHRANSGFSVLSSQRWTDAYAWASRPTAAKEYGGSSTYAHSPSGGQAGHHPTR